MKKINYRRYTDLPSLIQILTKKEITLLDPASWDDKNDSFFLATYKQRKNLKSVLALCFTNASETYHHWRVFSSGSSGVCVHFNGPELKSGLTTVQGVQFEEVTYLKVDELRKKRPTVNQLPFIKRIPFKAEREFRALWESGTESRSNLEIPIKLSIITRITLSPWLHPTLRENLILALKRIDGCKSIPMYRSTLTENARWIDYGDSAA